MNSVRLGERISHARHEMHLSIEDASARVNISAAYFYQIESGNRIPHLPIFVRICNTLCVTPSHLLADELELNESDPYRRACNALLQASPLQLRMIIAMLDSINEIERKP